MQHLPPPTSFSLLSLKQIISLCPGGGDHRQRAILGSHMLLSSHSTGDEEPLLRCAQTLCHSLRACEFRLELGRMWFREGFKRLPNQTGVYCVCRASSREKTAVSEEKEVPAPVTFFLHLSLVAPTLASGQSLDAACPLWYSKCKANLATFGLHLPPSTSLPSSCR